jgi:hypothetical protein
MKHTFISFLLIACVCAYATPAYSEEANPFAFKQSSQTNFSGSAYSSTVYQPFCTTTPSQQQESASNSYSPIAKSFSWGGGGMGDNKDDDPNRDPYSPVGEPWVMLAFAALAAGVIAYKRKKEPTLSLPKGKE